MDKRVSVLLTFMALVLLIFILYFSTNIFSKVTGYFVGESELEKLTKCLDSKNSELFIGSISKTSEDQINILGQSINNLRITECETSKSGEIIDQRCKNLKSVPAWYIDKEIHYGIKNISDLENISNCKED